MVSTAAGDWAPDHDIVDGLAAFAVGAETDRTQALFASTLTVRPFTEADAGVLTLTAAGTDPDDIRLAELTLTFTRAGTVTETTWVRLLTPLRPCADAGWETEAPTSSTATPSVRMESI